MELEPIDVTEQLRAQGHLVDEHRNDEDLVYRLGEHLVKVKTFREVSRTPVGLPTGHVISPIVVAYRFSGAVVGPDGKALRLEGDIPAVFGDGDHLSFKADQPVDRRAEIEAKRHRCARMTLAAWLQLAEDASMPGVGVRRVRDAG